MNTPEELKAADLLPVPGAEPPVETEGTRIDKSCTVAAGVPGVLQTALFTWKEMGLVHGVGALAFHSPGVLLTKQPSQPVPTTKIKPSLDAGSWAANRFSDFIQTRLPFQAVFESQKILSFSASRFILRATKHFSGSALPFQVASWS